MAKVKDEIDLIPRVSVLEVSQQAIQRDLSNLTHSVQRQGEQLTLAITQLSTAQNANFATLAEKIGASTKTDWQSFWSMIGVLILIGGSVMGYIQMQFTYHDKTHQQLQVHIDKLQDLAQEGIKERAVSSSKIEALEKVKKRGD